MAEEMQEDVPTGEQDTDDAAEENEADTPVKGEVDHEDATEEDAAEAGTEQDETVAEGDGEPGGPVDTTAEFLKIFRGKTEFNSWEEFSTLFEEFQRETGSAFKPKSATSVEFANERRVRALIPAHFVYQTVKMVCQHYGMPQTKPGPGRRAKKYIGLGCEAMVHLRYKEGALNIVSCNLEHKNHALFSGNEIIRTVRAFSFTNEVDQLIAKVVLEHNPFSHWNSEKEWMALVSDLQSRNETMKTVTVRVIKKRIRFLIDRYMANSNGKAPLPDDEMGVILYKLAKAKRDAMDNITKTPNKPGSTGKKRGRPRKHPLPPQDSEDEDMDAIMDADDSATFSPERKIKRVSATPSYSSSSTSSASSRDIAIFLRYMERKEENDRRLKQEEIDLRRAELELQKKETELHRERLEFNRLERQTLMDLLKTQLEALSTSRGQHPQQQQVVQHHQPRHQKLVVADPKGDGTGVTEYTIVLNNDQTFTTQ